MADDAGDLRVGELLRDRRAELRVGLVVLAHELELDRLAADLHLLRGRFLDREARAVLVVLAEVRDAAGQRAGVADLDRDGVVGRRRPGAGAWSSGASRLLGLFLAAAVDGDTSAAATSVRPILLTCSCENLRSLEWDETVRVI